MAWSPDRFELWHPAARRHVRALLLMLRHGRMLRSLPEEDPEDHFAHALPVDVGFWVLRAVGQPWVCSDQEVSWDLNWQF